MMNTTATQIVKSVSRRGMGWTMTTTAPFAASSHFGSGGAAAANSSLLTQQHQQLQRRGYHENIVEHYENPRNVGSLDKSDLSVGTVSQVKSRTREKISLLRFTSRQRLQGAPGLYKCRSRNPGTRFVVFNLFSTFPSPFLISHRRTLVHCE